MPVISICASFEVFVFRLKPFPTFSVEGEKVSVRTK